MRNYKDLSYLELFHLFFKIRAPWNHKELNTFLDKCSLIQRVHIANYMGADYCYPNRYRSYNVPKHKVPLEFRKLIDKNARIGRILDKLERIESRVFSNKLSKKKKVTNEDLIFLKKMQSMEAYEAYAIFERDREIKSCAKKIRQVKKITEEIDKIYKLRSLL